MGVVGEVEQPERIDKTEDDQIHGRLAITTVDEPMIAPVEVGHVGHVVPPAQVTATVPHSVDLDRLG